MFLAKTDTVSADKLFLMPTSKSVQIAAKACKDVATNSIEESQRQPSKLAHVSWIAVRGDTKPSRHLNDTLLQRPKLLRIQTSFIIQKKDSHQVALPSSVPAHQAVDTVSAAYNQVALPSSAPAHQQKAKTKAKSRMQKKTKAKAKSKKAKARIRRRCKSQSNSKSKRATSNAKAKAN